MLAVINLGYTGHWPSIDEENFESKSTIIKSINFNTKTFKTCLDLQKSGVVLWSTEVDQCLLIFDYQKASDMILVIYSLKSDTYIAEYQNTSDQLLMTKGPGPLNEKWLKANI